MDHAALSQNLPIQQAQTDKTLDVRPKKLKSWVASLPVTDTGRATRILFAALVELNRTQLSPKKRYEALDLLGPPYLHALQHLQKGFVGQPFPLKNRKHQAAMLFQSMQIEYARGYLSIVADSLQAGRSEQVGNQIDSKCLLISMEHLSQCIVWSCQFYLELPRTIWSDISALLEYALEAKQAPVVSANLQSNYEKIVYLYKKISLFWLSSPFALPGGEAATLVKMLDKWAPYCNQIDARQGQMLKEGIVIDDKTDEPMWHKSSNSNPLPKSGVVLDISSLLTLLSSEISKAKSGESSEEAVVPLEFLLRISKNLCNPKSRYLVRTSRSSKAVFTIGMNSAHHFISGADSKKKQAKPAPVSAVSKLAIDYSEDSPTEDNEGSWNLKYANLKANAEQASRQAAQSSQNQPEKYDCTIIDESAEGYSLNCNADRLPTVSIGDLIVISTGRPGSAWSVGIVRWLRAKRKGGIDIGVQLLAPTAYAISIKNPADTRTKQSRALFMPESIDQKYSDSILLPSGNYTSGFELILRNQRQESRIQLQEKLESGPSFQRFTCTGNAH